MSGIEVVNICKSWSGKAAVDQVSFLVPAASLTVLLGPSGCGKSTILRMIAGLEPVTSGEVLIGGEEVTCRDAARRGVSMVFQSYALFPHLNVRENIVFGLKVRKLPAGERRSRLEQAAQLLGLTELLERKPGQLSGGQRQRVALARTIVSRQPVCLMDEPLSNLDAKLRTEMRTEICRLQQNLGLTMLYVTHDQTEAMTMADQVILLKEGKVEQVGSPDQIYTIPATTFVARFIGHPPMNILAPAPLRQAGYRLGSLPDAWRLGIRPEKITVADQGVPARVEATDYLGGETILHLHCADQPILIRIAGRGDFRRGEKILVAWPEEAVHLFDPSGIRWRGSHPPPAEFAPA